MTFKSMVQGLTDSEVRFVVIGGLAAQAHGSAYLTTDLDICYEPTPANRRRLGELLVHWSAYPRGIESGLPFEADARQLTSTPLLTLVTAEGDLDCMTDVKGVGSWPAVLQASELTDGFDRSFHILRLDALIAAKKAAGRTKDLMVLPELEALLELRKRRGLS